MGLKTCFAYSLILCCLACPARGAGIQLLETPTLAGAIWYPCAAKPQSVPLGGLAVPFTNSLEGVKDCPVAGAKLPLVVFSHGRGGWFGLHHDTAEALADAGFVVAAISHPGDNGNDTSQSETLSGWASRPADMVHLIDFMLKDWKDRDAIDPSKIGLFGFSKGHRAGARRCHPRFPEDRVLLQRQLPLLRAGTERRCAKEPAARHPDQGRCNCRSRTDCGIHKEYVVICRHPIAGLAI